MVENKKREPEALDQQEQMLREVSAASPAPPSLLLRLAIRQELKDDDNKTSTTTTTTSTTHTTTTMMVMVQELAAVRAKAAKFKATSSRGRFIHIRDHPPISHEENLALIRLSRSALSILDTCMWAFIRYELSSSQRHT